MKLIPVIDLMQGRVVWARSGTRRSYAPLSSPLCPDSDPMSLAGRLVHDFGAAALYIADLDAITGAGHNWRLLRAIAERFPRLALWVDAGLSDRNALERFLAGAAGRPVIGTETLAEKTLLSQPEARGAVLSLDFRGPNLVGPSDLMERPQLWPQDLILMSLHRVGSSTGPAMDLLARCRALAPHHRFYSAGGVRDLHDLATLQAAGAAGVLLASALHDGHITPREAAELR